VPFFLFGLAGLFAWRVSWVQRLLSGLTAPLVGSLHWFVGHQMALGRRRIVSLVFVAALSMSLSLLPQVAADSFFDRVLRGVVDSSSSISLRRISRRIQGSRQRLSSSTAI
jgi:hypothetical protein